MLIMHLGTSLSIGVPRGWTLPSPFEVSLESISLAQPRRLGQPFARIAMPQAGQAYADAVRSPPGRFDMRLTLVCGMDRLAVNAGPLHDGDRIMMVGGFTSDAERPHAAPRGVFSGVVMHQMPTTVLGDCAVQCASGETVLGECCVECTSGDITLKFCC